MNHRPACDIIVPSSYIETFMPWRRGHQLRLVPERDAPARTREIYQEIKYALGLPCVSPIFQAYASYPLFLEMHWARLRPVVAGQEFFELAGRLRADAYTRVYSYLEVPDLRTRVQSLGKDVLREIDGIVELFHYANPLLLMIAAAQLQAFDGPVGRNQPPTVPASHPVFTTDPELGENAAGAEVRKLCTEIRRTLGMPLLGSTFPALARWPGFLALYWNALKHILQSPIYQEGDSNLRETAWTLTRELPGAFELTLDQLIQPGIDDQGAASLVRMTERFVHIFSALTLSISVARIGLEGGTERAMPAAKSPSGPQAAA